jgi:hypothetical protein
MELQQSEARAQSNSAIHRRGIMSGRRVRWGKAILLIGMLLAGTRLAAASFSSPEAIIKAIYGLYSTTTTKKSEGPYNGNCSDADSERGKGFPGDLKGAELYLEPALARAYAHPPEEIDADPFIMGQDWCLRDLVISVDKTDGKKATVTARFTNLGNASKVTYQLINTAKGWLIYDLSSSDFPSLRKLVKAKT